MKEAIQDLLNQANHKSIPTVDMRAVWFKLTEALSIPAATIDTYGEAIKALSIDEKLALVNIINLSRPEFRGITGLGSNNSPMFALLKTPVPTLTRQEHKDLRLRVGKYGDVAIYLMYPSLSIACYALAAILTDWPSHVIEKDENEKPVSGLAYEHYCYSKDIEKHNQSKDWGEKTPTSTQASVAYRLNTGVLVSPSDVDKGTVPGHGLAHPFFKKLLSQLDEKHTVDYKTLKLRNRFLYQGTTLFGLNAANSIYDINNVVTLRGPTISGYGYEILSKAQIAAKEEAYKQKCIEAGEPWEL